jgi:threonine/homoserine/homoserine lactone efflux protein
LNPKVLVFALVIIPLDEPNAEHYVGAFLAILIPVGLSWIAFGAAARRIVHHRLIQLVPKVASIALVGFAVLLVGSSSS